MKFDYTITLGNAIEILSILVSGAVVTVGIWFRLKAIEEWIDDHKKCALAQLAVTNAMLSSLAYIQGALGLKKDGVL